MTRRVIRAFLLALLVALVRARTSDILRDRKFPDIDPLDLSPDQYTALIDRMRFDKSQFAENGKLIPLARISWIRFDQNIRHWFVLRLNECIEEYVPDEVGNERQMLEWEQLMSRAEFLLADDDLRLLLMTIIGRGPMAPTAYLDSILDTYHLGRGLYKKMLLLSIDYNNWAVFERAFRSHQYDDRTASNALGKAALLGRTRMVQVLLEKYDNSRLDIRDAMLKAAESGSIEAFKILEQKLVHTIATKTDERDMRMRFFLSDVLGYAVSTGSSKMVEYLLKHSHYIDVNLRRGAALKNAAWKRDERMIESLLKHGANVVYADYEPIIITIRNRYYAGLEVFFQAGLLAHTAPIRSILEQENDVSSLKWFSRMILYYRTTAFLSTSKHRHDYDEVHNRFQPFEPIYVDESEQIVEQVTSIPVADSPKLNVTFDESDDDSNYSSDQLPEHFPIVNRPAQQQPSEHYVSISDQSDAVDPRSEYKPPPAIKKENLRFDSDEMVEMTLPELEEKIRLEQERRQLEQLKAQRSRNAGFYNSNRFEYSRSQYVSSTQFPTSSKTTGASGGGAASVPRNSKVFRVPPKRGMVVADQNTNSSPDSQTVDGYMPGIIPKY